MKHDTITDRNEPSGDVPTSATSQIPEAGTEEMRNSTGEIVEASEALEAPEQADTIYENDPHTLTSEEEMPSHSIPTAPVVEMTLPNSLTSDTSGLSSSPMLSALAHDNDGKDERCTPFFVSPGPLEDILDDNGRVSHTRMTTPAFDSIVPTPRSSNPQKRSFETLTGQNQRNSPPHDESEHTIKRSKTDIKTLKAELEDLAKRKEESTHRVEAARRKREEHEVNVASKSNLVASDGKPANSQRTIRIPRTREIGTSSIYSGRQRGRKGVSGKSDLNMLHILD